MSIQSQIDRINAIKERIRTNLIAQGVAVPNDATLEEMAVQILSVSGEDGISATHSWNGTTLTITSASGTSSANLKGAAGTTPVKGTDYFTAADKAEMVEDVLEAMDGIPTVVCQSTAPADTSVIWVDPDDNSVDEFQEVVNTALAQAKASGEFNPIKGTDYWTPADQESIVQQVLNVLGSPIVGNIDANKNIALSGDLANGIYQISFVNTDGTITNIGSLEIGGVAYTNQLPISTDASGAIYNGKGWKENTRISSSGGETTQDGIGLTGFIPCGNKATIRVKSNVAVTSDYSNQSVALYDSSKTFIGRLNWAAITTGDNKYLTINSDGSIEYEFNLAYWTDYAGKTVSFIRLSFPGINDNAIVTINEEIV